MKTRDEARKMAEMLRAEADSLPDYSLFGDSNEEAKQESYGWASALELYAGGASEAVVIASDDTGEVWAWLTGGSSALSDME